jgi:hypothetical protein
MFRTYNSIPELASLPRAEQKRLWRKCYPNVLRHWQFWIANLAPIAPFVALPIWVPIASRFLVSHTDKVLLVRLTLYLALTVTLLAMFVPGQVATHLLRPQLKRERWGHWCRCGYDLTGNVSGVCPECGTPVNPQSGR